MARQRKIVSSGYNTLEGTQWDFAGSFNFRDNDWNDLKNHLPMALSDDTAANVRMSIELLCSELFAERIWLKEAMMCATIMRRPSKGQPATFEKLTKGLRLAADAWKEITEAEAFDPSMHSNIFLDLHPFGLDELEKMAKEAELRLSELQSEKIEEVKDPWPAFVRDVAVALRVAGVKPSITGSIYDATEPKPTWFQEFMFSLNTALKGWRIGEEPHSNQAFYAGIAKAMRSDVKPGKSRQ